MAGGLSESAHMGHARDMGYVWDLELETWGMA